MPKPDLWHSEKLVFFKIYFAKFISNIKATTKEYIAPDSIKACAKIFDLNKVE